MKYFIRSVKYFFHIWILISAMLAVLIAVNYIPSNHILENGWKSFGWMLVLTIIFSAIYPKLGYSTRRCSISGEWSEVSQKVKDFMNSRNFHVFEYENTTDGNEVICYRAKKFIHKLSRDWEDRITIKPVLGGISIEGPNKDVVSLLNAMIYKFYREESDDNN